ncbi:MAG: PAS domain S-box protein, partial [Bacteroidales bacterium]|nr:PAS domain S-box protein [Bacteroidales bacterium]
MNLKPTYKELEEELAFLKTTNKLIEKSPIVRFIWKNQKNWPVEYVSENVKNIFGYSADDFIKNKIVYSEIIFPDDIQRVENEVSSHSKTGFSSIEHEPYRIISKSGEIKWLNDITLIRRNINNEISHYEGIIIDISEQTKTEKELIENEIRFRDLYENTPIPYHSLDEEGFFIEANPVWLSILGYKKNEVIGTYYGDLLHPEFKEHFKQKFPEFKKKGEVHTFFKLRHKDGSYIDVSLDGNIGHHPDGSFKQTHCVFKDITERKKAEEIIKRQSASITQSPSIIVMTNPKGDIIYANPSFEKSTGYTLDEAIGKKLSILKSGKHSEQFYKEIWESIKNGEYWQGEIHNRKKDGTYFWEFANISPIYDESENLINFIKTSEDITARKKAEQALKESENKFSKTFYSDVALMAISTLKDGKLINVNEMFLETLKHKKEEVIGKTTTEINILSDPSQRDEVSKIIRKKGSVQNVDVDILTKNGEIRHGIFSAHLIEINGEDCMFSTFNDITDRKNAEQALKESEELMSLFMDSATDGFMLWSSDLHLLKANNTALSLLPKGTKMEDVIGKSLFELSPNIKKSGRHDKYLEVIKTGTPFFIDEFIPDLGKGKIHLSLRAFKVGNGVGVITTDITDRKNAEQAIAESKQKFESMILNSPDLIMSQNTVGKLKYISHQCEDVLGYTVEEIKNIDISKLIHPDDIEKTTKTESTTLGGLKLNNFEYRFLKKNGDYVWLNHAARPIIVDGKITEILSTVRDITERKKIEQELREQSIFINTLLDN